MRLRIRMPDGTEFEAEGTEEFVLSERERFVRQFVQKIKSVANSANTGRGEGKTSAIAADKPVPNANTSTIGNINKFINIDTEKPVKAVNEPESESNPAVRGNAGVSQELFDFGGTSVQSNPAQQTGNGGLWQELTVPGKNGHLIIASKPENLSAADAILILLAAERQINGTQALPALAISKMAKASGFHHTRLDRLLQDHVRSGLIRHEGTKRNRIYYITDSGFQKAALMAHSFRVSNSS